MDERLTNRCACGWEITGPPEDVVTATIEHGQRLHNMTATREQILAQTVPAAGAARPASPVEPETPSGGESPT